MRIFFKLLLGTVFFACAISCTPLKIEKENLVQRLENSDKLRMKMKRIRNSRTCKEFLVKDKRIFTREILYETLNGEPYDSITKAKCLITSNYPEGIVFIIHKITDTTEIGLKDYYDVNIWDRVESGDMIFDYGEMINDDLFRISGRCNYLLKKLTGQDFGFARMNSSQKELTELQKKWIDWVLSL